MQILRNYLLKLGPSNSLTMFILSVRQDHPLILCSLHLFPPSLRPTLRVSKSILSLYHILMSSMPVKATKEIHIWILFSLLSSSFPIWELGIRFQSNRM